MPSWSRLGTVLGWFWVGFGSVLERFWGRFEGSWGVLSVVLGVFARSSGVLVGLVGSWRRLLIFGPLLLPAIAFLHVACWVPAACLRNSRQCNALPVPMLSQVYLGGLGSLLVGLGAPSGRSWAVLGRSWAVLGRSKIDPKIAPKLDSKISRIATEKNRSGATPVDVSELEGP